MKIVYRIGVGTGIRLPRLPLYRIPGQKLLGSGVVIAGSEVELTGLGI